MKTQILRCVNCLNYTFQEVCPKCSSKCITTKPAKFSLEDKYGNYRREYKTKNEMGN